MLLTIVFFVFSRFVVIQEKDHFPFFDCAYQGFATGDLQADAVCLTIVCEICYILYFYIVHGLFQAPVRLFAELGFELLVCQSFAKVCVHVL